MTTAERLERELLQKIGEELRILRTEKGLSRVEFVKQYAPDLPATTLAGYEQGIRQCPIGRLVDLCQALDTTLPAVLTRALGNIDGYYPEPSDSVTARLAAVELELRRLRRVLKPGSAYIVL